MHRNESEPLLGASERSLSRRFSDIWRGGAGGLSSSSGNTLRPASAAVNGGSGSVPTDWGSFPNTQRRRSYDSLARSGYDHDNESVYSHRSTSSRQPRTATPISEETENSGSFTDSFVGSERSLHSLPGSVVRQNSQPEELRLDDLCLLQACVFIEDAVQYRSINHKVDGMALKLYQFYYSRPVQWCLYFVMFLLHILAFIEKPSSLTWSSDVRTRPPPPEPPCGLTEGIEIVCLLVLLLNLLARLYFLGWPQFKTNKWMLVYGMIIVFSIVEWFVSIGTLCHYKIRVRRMLRPFFLLQNSTLMKKIVNCLRRTLPHVFSVLLLLFVHLYFFSLFGMLLFPKDPKAHANVNATNTTGTGESISDESEEQMVYFDSLGDSFMNLLVLLTTANNPDVTMPAYSLNRFYSLFFIVFLVIGLLCLMNMLTAVIYNQFRGYFSNSLQSSLFRRRLAIRAAFEVLRQRRVALTHRSRLGTVAPSVIVLTLKQVLQRAKIHKAFKVAMLEQLDREYEDQLLNYSQFQTIFRILEADLATARRPAIHDVRNPCLQKLQAVVVHSFVTYLSCVVACANVLCITIELSLEFEHIRETHSTFLGLFNLFFILYYLLEQSLRLWALGWRLYCWDKGNVFDGVITIFIVLLEVSYLSVYGIPFQGEDNLSNNYKLQSWDFVRIICILIMIRVLRLIIIQVKTMYIVALTLVDLVQNLTPFAGLLVVIYYSYALLGMALFEGKIVYTNVTNESLPAGCGSYRQLEYWANNFDDFASAIVVLWDIMIVNNWHVFLHAYSFVTTHVSQIYFIIWWLLSVVITLNLFTAVILENFIMKWDRAQQRSSSLTDSYVAGYTTVHEMFREDLLEPSEESLMVELRQHPHLQMIS